MRPTGTRFATPRQAGQRLVAVCAKDHLGTAVDLLRLGQVPSLGRMVWKFHGGRTSRTCGSRWTNLQRGDVPMINVLEICIPVAAPIASKKGVLCRQGNWGFIPVAQAVGRLAPRAPLQYNHEQASSSDTDILIPEADLAGGGGSSARARRLVHKTGARPGFRHGRGTSIAPDPASGASHSNRIHSLEGSTTMDAVRMQTQPPRLAWCLFRGTKGLRCKN